MTESPSIPVPTPGLHEAAVEILRSWSAPGGGQAALREAYLAFLLAGPHGLWRAHAPGHLTASGIVLDATGRLVLLVLHPRAQKWLPPGGHLEPQDVSLAGAALREVQEETGLVDASVDSDPLHLDAHPFTCSLGVPTRHLDLTFLVRAPATPDGSPPEPVSSEESIEVRWWPVDALPEPRTPRLEVEVAAARARQQTLLSAQG